MTAPSAGDVVSGHRLERLIDDTGRSQVWVAHDERLDRNVALKIQDFDDAQAAVTEQARFAEQARTAARVEHPGVVPVYCTGLEAGTAYLAMRYVQGRNLAQWRRSRRATDPRSIARLLEPVAAAIDHAHVVGVAHGSLTAEAIVVDEGAEPNRAVLLPFAGREGEAGRVDPGEAEADRIAFAGLLQTLARPTSEPAGAPGAGSCLEILRDALPAGDGGPPTPQTVIRTRRTRSGRARLAVGLSTAAVIIVTAVTAAALLVDVADQVGAPDASGPAETVVADIGGEGAQAAPADDAPKVVLILGEGFGSWAGGWTASNRTPVWWIKEGKNAADVIEAAFFAIQGTSYFRFERVPLKSGNPARCNAAVADALDRRAYVAIIVLRSPCGKSVMRQIGAREPEVPPVYWLDDGSDTQSLLVPMAVAPLRNAEKAGEPGIVSEIRRDLGDWSGEAAARVLPFGTYSDVGRFAAREFDSSEPCMFLPLDLGDPAVTPRTPDWQLRINHATFEFALGFDRDPTDIVQRQIWLPFNRDDSDFYLPANGSVLGSNEMDGALLTAIETSGAPCVFFEFPNYLALPDVGLPWIARLLTLITTKFPDLRIIVPAHPNDPYSPDADRMSAADARAWQAILKADQTWMLSSAPYTPPKSPLSGHVWQVAYSQYRPIDFDRESWWWTDHYALVLVAELIARQTVDEATGRQQFGSIPAGEWSAVEADSLDEDTAVTLDPVERIYSGYLVVVHRKGELWDAFYGGATE